MGVGGDQALGDPIVGEELLGVPGILTGDDGDALQRLYGSVGDVAKVADGGSHQVEGTHVLQSTHLDRGVQALAFGIIDDHPW